MIENIPILLKSIGSATDAIKVFTGWKSKTKGDVRAIVEELKENSRYLWLIIEEHIPLDDVIDKMLTTEYDRLLKEGFDFNSLKRSKISKYSSLERTDLSSWQGKETEHLVLNIYDKIKDLKTQYPFTKNSSKIRWMIRVKNVQKRILLLLKHAAS